MLRLPRLQGLKAEKGGPAQERRGGRGALLLLLLFFCHSYLGLFFFFCHCERLSTKDAVPTYEFSPFQSDTKTERELGPPGVGGVGRGASWHGSSVRAPAPLVWRRWLQERTCHFPEGRVWWDLGSALGGPPLGVGGAGGSDPRSPCCWFRPSSRLLMHPERAQLMRPPGPFVTHLQLIQVVRITALTLIRSKKCLLNPS